MMLVTLFAKKKAKKHGKILGRVNIFLFQSHLMNIMELESTGEKGIVTTAAEK